MRAIIALAYLMDESLGERPRPSKYSPTCRGCRIRSKLAGWISEGDRIAIDIGIEIRPTPTLTVPTVGTSLRPRRVRQPQVRQVANAGND